MIISHLELGLSVNSCTLNRTRLRFHSFPLASSKKKTSYFNLSVDVWNLFLFVPVHLNASKGKGSLTHLTFKEYLKIYFESLRLNLAQIKKKSKSIIFEGLKHHLKEEAIDRRKRN